MKKIVMRGIDASRYNNINFGKLKNRNPDLDFVMLRIGGTEDVEYMDKTFDEKWNDAKAAGFHIGVYYMLPKKIIASRQYLHLVSLLNKYDSFTMPLVLDCELQDESLKESNTKQLVLLAEMLEKTGYYVMIYSTEHHLSTCFQEEKIVGRFDLWLALWSSTEPQRLPFGMWQYSSKGVLAGVEGVIDLDYAYYNYPEIMKARSLNKNVDGATLCKVCVHCNNKNCEYKENI